MSAVRAKDGTRRAGADTLDPERLGDALARLTRSLRREVRLPLGASSMAVLATLHDQGRTRLGDLAKQEGVTPATLSRIVSMLEEEGYAARVVDDADRRSAFLEVTAAGRRVVVEARQERARVLRERAETLTDEQRETLAAAVEALELLSTR